MKILVQMIVLLTLVGCASPFRTVYTSAEGDYYIEELAQPAGYYLGDSVLYAGIGFDPWWIVAYSPATYVYYDPYYYLYYLSAWYPRAYQPHDGYFGWYDPYWCPPFRMRRVYSPTDKIDPIDHDPMSSPVPGIARAIDSRDTWKTINLTSRKKALGYSGDAKYRGYDPTRSGASARSILPPTRITPRRDYPAVGAGSVPRVRAMAGEARPTYQPPAMNGSSSPMISAPSAVSISSGVPTSGVEPLKSKQ